MSVWQLAEYFIVVSIVAILLLAMKRLFHDKLDARWHYFIWLVLGVRMVVPLSIEWLKSPLSLFEAIPVNYWARWLALKAERAGIAGLLQYVPTVYLIGVCLLAGYYLVVAVAVRIKNQRLEPAEQAVYDYVADVAAKYELKPCKRIRVGAGAMPCVCGLILPVLVLPKEGVAEEVIVHELLHKKYGDVWINYALHLVRALNWFNPLMWYVTAVILNDSEALCDQRVLERMAQQRQLEAESVEQPEHAVVSVEKTYGTLLLNMARKRSAHNTKIGTTNMANSYRSMRTRMRRIVDFGRVPAGVGFVALCITTILSVSTIGYCEGKGIISCGVEDEGDLERVMLRALTYQPETTEQAIYLYMKAMKEMNPIYLLPVTPKEDLPQLEAWIWDMFEQDKFIRWVVKGQSCIGNAEDAAYLNPAHWISVNEEMLENPWYVWDGDYITRCYIYNLQGDEEQATATAELYVTDSGENVFVEWDLECVFEKGWKVRRVDEEVFQDTKWHENPQPLLETEETGTDWRIEVIGYNSAEIYSLFQNNFGWRVYEGKVPTVKEHEEAAEYPLAFDMHYKNSRAHAVYLGEESLADKEVYIDLELYTEEEFEKEQADGTSLADISAEKLKLQAIYDGKDYSTSNGKGGRCLEGDRIAIGEKILINGSGTGPDSWDGTEGFHFVARIYYDGECVEVIKK